jgi:hypothetical protein
LSIYTSDETGKRFYALSDRLTIYGSRISSFTRSLLQTSLKIISPYTLGGRNLEGRVSHYSTRLKLLNALRIPFNAANVPAEAAKIGRTYASGDRKGMALTTLSFSILALDLADGLGTFVNTALAMGSYPVSSLIASTGTPLGLTISGMATLSRTIHIISTLRFARRLNSESSNYDQLSATLREKLNISNEEIEMFIKLRRNVDVKMENLSAEEIARARELIQSKKNLAMRYAAPLGVVEDLKNLERLISKCDRSSEVSKRQVEGCLNKILFKLKEKMTLDVAQSIANILIFIGLLLFLASVPPVLPFILISSSYAIRLSLLAYEDLRS